MTEKQTRCPNCDSIYKVSVTQLTVAQGMVCCPKCNAEFNALLHLIQPSSTFSSIDEVSNHITSQQQDQLNTLHTQNEINLLDIFERKTEDSNINLRTYLNNLNSFNNDSLSHFPTLNLGLGLSHQSHSKHSPKTMYYIIWSVVNLLLVLILIFQILWFNPNILNRSALLNSVFINTCNLFNCETIDQRYTYIEVKQIKIKNIGHQSTEFSGVLVNQYEKGLELPLIKVSLIKNGVIHTSLIKAPKDYLIPSLSGITRIPTNSPYKFQFKLNIDRNAFDTYRLEVIRP